MELKSGKFLKKTELKGGPISCWAVLNWRLMFLLPFCIIITKPFDFHCLLFTAKMAVASGELQSSRPKFLKIMYNGKQVKTGFVPDWFSMWCLFLTQSYSMKGKTNTFPDYS